MSAIVFGVMVALAVGAYFSALTNLLIAIDNGDDWNGIYHVAIAFICTGIAAGMAYGGGV